MKRLSTIFVALALLALLPAFASDFTEVPNSASHDGKYAARTERSTDAQDGRDYLSLYRKGTGEVFTRLPIGGYARYPMDADPANLQILWSPDSKHFVLMVRGMKRSWAVVVYAIGTKGVREVKLPSPTTEALALLSASGIVRVARETPSKWIDDDHLLLRASGDTLIDGKSIWYEVDLTFSLRGGNITESKVVTKKPYEG